MVVCPLCREGVFTAGWAACRCGALAMTDSGGFWTFAHRGSDYFLRLTGPGLLLVRMNKGPVPVGRASPEQVVEEYLLAAEAAEVLCS